MMLNMTKSKWDMMIGGTVQWVIYYLFWLQPGIDRTQIVRYFYEWPSQPGAGIGILAAIVIGAIPVVCLVSYAILYHFEWPVFEK
jgi:uncharacterized integral membrane protein